MLINCVAYQEGKKLSDIPVEDISEYVKHPDCFCVGCAARCRTSRACRNAT